MNILVICRELPYPLNAGYKIRTFNLIKGLSRDHAISLICYGDQKYDCAGIRQYCKTLKIIPPQKISRFKQAPNIIKNMLSGQPFSVKYVKSTAMKAAINEIIQSTRFDLIHFDDPYIVSNFDLCNENRIKKTITFHDIDSMKYMRMFKIESGIYKKILLLFDLMMLKRWEKEITNKADLSIVTSAIDLQSIRQQVTDAKVSIVPNGVDIDSYKFRRKNNSGNTIVFVGAMDYMPNHDAALYFYRQILPIIISINSDVKFIIVGRNPNQELQALADDPRVFVAGNVDDVTPYYEKSVVAVVPLRAGGGTRLKILEAMAVGCPVVSTSIGSEGLGVTHSKNIMIADTPENFAKYTVELMKNEAQREEQSNLARHFVENFYSWERIAGTMSKTYRDIMMN
ncbi:MAG TPA: glycosyltransferase family 4 protein [Negativicutes bacterium]|jgi:sugar transferase (PEP-CTERM/EpsH1 system associated)